MIIASELITQYVSAIEGQLDNMCCMSGTYHGRNMKMDVRDRLLFIQWLIRVQNGHLDQLVDEWDLVKQFHEFNKPNHKAI